MTVFLMSANLFKTWLLARSIWYMTRFAYHSLKPCACLSTIVDNMFLENLKFVPEVQQNALRWRR